MDSKKRSINLRNRGFLFYISMFISCVSLMIVLSLGFVYIKYQKIGLNLLPEPVIDNRIAKDSFPIYCDLEPFTLNIMSSHSAAGRVLHLGLTLKVVDEASNHNLKVFLPEVRSRLLVLFSQQRADELLTPEGKELLSINIKDALNQPIGGGQHISVSDVLFNTFIIR